LADVGTNIEILDQDENSKGSLPLEMVLKLIVKILDVSIIIKCVSYNASELAAFQLERCYN